ncbi:MAG: hypothetical protein HRU07_01255 [Nitrosopumilus sp.]|nr:hypothetical protein [Nitrosopumilus sp.]NRA04801.1 hypothetical protein [Nitrosopumilus sp.]
MAILEGAVLSTFLNELVRRFSKKLDEVKPKDRQIVIVKQDPNSFFKSELVKVKTDKKKWTTKDKPILQFENILEKESIVKEISIIPDKNFKTKGKLLITVDDSEIFQSKTFDAFEDVAELVIPINKTIQQNSKIRLFMISKDDAEIGLTAFVTFGE